MAVRKSSLKLRQSHHNPPLIPQKTMDPKFIVVLFCVETGALVFNSIHAAAPQIHIYNSYNQKPIIYNQSSQLYSCFQAVNYCIYEHTELRFLKVIHLIFTSMIVIFYFSLFIIIRHKWENTKIQQNLGITWYGAMELSVLLTLALHTLLMAIIYERDYLNIKQCNKDSRLVRGENLFTHVVLSILEITYIGFDILNRQASIHALHQKFENRARKVEYLTTSQNDTPTSRQSLSQAESFVTVHQEFIPDLV